MCANGVGKLNSLGFYWYYFFSFNVIINATFLRPKFELARNRNMLSLLVTHTMNRNSHKYLVDLLTSHMIQYSSGYDLRFPRKRSPFESQVGNNINLLLLLFSICVCSFYFDFFLFYL